MAMVPLCGYTDRLSGRPGDLISFKVSSTLDKAFTVRLVRIISADSNPEGCGIVEQDVASDIAGPYPSRMQPFFPGSYAVTDQPVPLCGSGGLRLEATIWPTLCKKTDQVILAVGNACIFVRGDGQLAARAFGARVASGCVLKERHWYRVWLSYDPGTRLLQAGAQEASGGRTVESGAEVTGVADMDSGVVSIAAILVDGRARDHFNGKIETPCIFASPHADEKTLAARWDFSLGIQTTAITDTGPNGCHGKLVNMPARGMTGSSWQAQEMCWRHAGEHYGAIHFHDDDIYDFGWETDFSFTIPQDLPAGVYAARIACGEHEDALPFFVLPARSERRADLCVLISTFTYVVYGNHARPDFVPAWKERFVAWNAYPHNPAEHREYGLSTYNYHSDGSGICHASHKRPLFNLRPGYVTFGYGPGSGLRHFQADSHLLSWLHAKGIAYDVVTDQELHDEGLAAIAGYKAVTTGSHPEYHTAQTLDALEAYRDSGGRLMYLGGNGFYWRVALHGQEDGLIEIRRGEGGIRAWASEPGEYYNAFDGTYGGLWRRSGRPPQRLAGVGFSAQGQFEGSYYRRKTGREAPPSAEWVFAGIDEEVIGDFGLSGGGAAGFELDRADVRLGSPDNVEVLASSENHSQSFVLVPEEQLTHITNLPGEPVDKLLRADMVYFSVPGGGEVFSTGSITFCGSLPHNNFDNNVSMLLENVLRRFTR